MIRVASLHIYPVKSCRGVDLAAAEVVATGFRRDRHWMVVDRDGVFLSQRNHPEMATIRPRLATDALVVECDGHPTLEVPLASSRPASRPATVWNDTGLAVAEGRAAADWFSAVLGIECELVRQADHEPRPIDPTFAPAGGRVSYADGFPFLLISRASVDALNRRLDSPVAADRFRANIVVDGCGPHAEDGWAEIEIGGIGLDVAKPCARCIVITTDQRDGSRSPEPLQTLASYRTASGKVLFGQNLVHRSTGWIRVGDEVRIRGRSPLGNNAQKPEIGS